MHGEENDLDSKEEDIQIDEIRMILYMKKAKRGM